MKYLILFSFSAEAAKRYVANPADRMSAVREVTESVGGSLESSYWMLGDYDGLTIVDLPDTLTAAAVSMALSGSGAFSRYETRELIPPGDYRAIAERAQAISFRPPGD